MLDCLIALHILTFILGNAEPNMPIDFIASSALSQPPAFHQASQSSLLQSNDRAKRSSPYIPISSSSATQAPRAQAGLALAHANVCGGTIGYFVFIC